MADGPPIEHETGDPRGFSRDEKIVAGSDRSFGLVMAGGIRGRDAAERLACRAGCGRGPAALAALFLAAALLRPALLNPLNRLWLKFGLLLHRWSTRS